MEFETLRRSVIVVLENRHGAHGGAGERKALRRNRVFRNFEMRPREDFTTAGEGKTVKFMRLLLNVVVVCRFGTLDELNAVSII